MNRTFDATFLNSVCNHPEVRPWLSGEGGIDVTAALKDPDNVALVNDAGGFIMMQHEPGIYEAHSQFLPDMRGGTRQAMRECFDYMFTRTDCERMITQIPDNNRGAIALGKAGKFREMFRRDTPRGPTAFVGLTLEEWAQDTPALEQDGAWFHDNIHAAVKKVLPHQPDHPHDPAHDRAVGAAVRMCRAGNVHKGIGFYNRWARFAGYTPATVVSDIPPVIDVSEVGLHCIIGLRDNEMEILLCQSA